tara:strand:- start:2590 stop:2751 length:162 start_codon:yes stop_codon:yes gene_type:complete
MIEEGILVCEKEIDNALEQEYTWQVEYNYLTDQLLDLKDKLTKIDQFNRENTE